MEAYLKILQKILDEGVRKENRTGIDTIAIAGAMFEHDMSLGFPLVTTKQIPFRLIASENEFFLKGITDKKWLQERKNHIWDEWCSPKKVPYGHGDEIKKKMLEERDLGPIYGWQWRHFGGKYTAYDTPAEGGIDQVKNVIEKLKADPNDRRMIISAWNPLSIKEMALPPCHYSFQLTVIGKKLNLLWNQRSVDSVLGLPFNIAGYGLLLHLFAKEAGLEEGKLVGFLADTHIYVNHLEGLKEQMARQPLPLPKIKTENWKGIFEWQYTDTTLEGYEHHPRIKFEVAV